MSRLDEMKQVMRWSDKEFREFIDELRVELTTKSSNDTITTHTKAITTEQIITRYLHDMGVPENLLGFRYLVCAIEYAMKNPSALDAIVKQLYSYVAEQCNTKPSRAERAIRHAVEVSADRGDLRSFEEVFGNSVNPYKGKPTNSEFIAASVNYLRLKYFSK